MDVYVRGRLVDVYAFLVAFWKFKWFSAIFKSYLLPISFNFLLKKRIFLKSYKSLNISKAINFNIGYLEVYFTC